MEITPFVEQVIQHSPVSMQVLDRDGTTVRVNEAFLRFFGIPDRAEVEGVINLRSDPRMASHGLSEYIERAFEGEVVHIPTAEFRSGTGPARVIRAVVFPIRDDNGEIAQVVLIHEDMTELQDKASNLERRYQQISALQRAFRDIGEVLHADAVLARTLAAMDHLCAPDACAIWGRSGGRWVNLASRGLSERYLREITDMYAQAPPYWHAPMEEIARNQAVHIEDAWKDSMTAPLLPILEREGIRRLLAIPLQSGHAVEGAMMFYGRTPGVFDPIDVEVAHLLADQTAIALHNAQLLQQAREAEAEARILYQTSSILAQSLQLDSVLNALSEAVAPLMNAQRVLITMVDHDRGETRIVAGTGIDREMMRQRGYDRPRRLADDFSGLQRIVESGDPFVLRDVQDVVSELTDAQRALLADFNMCSALVVPLRTDGRTIGVISLDNPGETKDWSEREIRLAQGIASQTATTIRNAGLYEDVRAARAHLEERVRESTSELRVAHNEVVASERLAAIGIMAREVAHGLRNPLNVIATSLYYLKSRFPEPDEKVTRHFDTIARSVEQSANMINQLMNIAGPRRPEMAPVDLNQLVRRCLQDRFTAREVRWTAEWDDTLPYVSGDWIQLNHAVKALIGNAVGVEETGGQEREPILVRTGRDGEMAFLEVGDHRAHLTEEARDALFEPFFVSATQWTGLGLSVARQIASKHGGDVSVRDEGDTTWFRMTLPLVDTSGEDPDEAYD